MGGDGAPGHLWRLCPALPRELKVLPASFPVKAPACLRGPIKKSAKGAAEWHKDSSRDTLEWGCQMQCHSPGSAPRSGNVDRPPTRAQGGGGRQAEVSWREVEGLPPLAEL